MSQTDNHLPQGPEAALRPGCRQPACHCGMVKSRKLGGRSECDSERRGWLLGAGICARRASRSVPEGSGRVPHCCSEYLLCSCASLWPASDLQLAFEWSWLPGARLPGCCFPLEKSPETDLGRSIPAAAWLQATCRLLRCPAMMGMRQSP